MFYPFYPIFRNQIRTIPYIIFLMSRSDIFEYDNERIAYKIVGSGKPLLILHGWGSSSDVMMSVAKKVEALRTCYLIDFPGFGDSPEPKNAWSVSNYTKMVEKFIIEVIQNESTDLLVHSYGARVALKLLSDKSASQKIDKVIITGGAGLKPRRKPVYYLKKYTAKILKMPFLFLPGSLRETGLNRLRNSAIWKKLGSSDYQKLSGVMRETFVKSVTEYLDPLLQKIDHEILLIWGENDAATPIDQGIRLEKGLKNSALVKIKDAGHYAFLDQPYQFDAVLKAYLEAE